MELHTAAPKRRCAGRSSLQWGTVACWGRRSAELKRWRAVRLDRAGHLFDISGAACWGWRTAFLPAELAVEAVGPCRALAARGRRGDLQKHPRYAMSLQETGDARQRMRGRTAILRVFTSQFRLARHAYAMSQTCNESADKTRDARQRPRGMNGRVHGGMNGRVHLAVAIERPRVAAVHAWPDLTGAPVSLFCCTPLSLLVGVAIGQGKGRQRKDSSARCPCAGAYSCNPNGTSLLQL